MAFELGTLSCSCQIHAVTVVSTLARALTGSEWEAQQPPPQITPG